MIKMKQKVLNELTWIGFSLIIGFAFSCYLLPDLVFHPTNTNILRQDPLQHFLGWEFFRQSPWQWPLTYTHRLLYPIGTTIVFTDSFPLLAILLKLFSRLLPEPFVFQGLVAILNSSLMFYSGSLFLRKLRPDLFFNIIGGFFVLLSSVFIWRFFGHFSLTSQWLIVFELLLIMKYEAKIKSDIMYQGLLIFIATGTHPYFVAMITPLSMAFSWKLYSRQCINRLPSIALFAGFVLFALLSGWFFGWFANYSSGTNEGYSYFSNNLWALINPLYGSILLKTLPQGPGEVEGFCYLGLGLIIPLVGIFFVSLLGTANSRVSGFRPVHGRNDEVVARKEYYLLMFILGAFFLYGLGGDIQIGDAFHLRLFGIGRHSHLGMIFNIFRCSGRFIWPVFYFIQFFTLIVIYDLLHSQRKKCIIVLSLLCILQIFDNSYLITSVKKYWAENNQQASMTKMFSLNTEIWSHLREQGIKHLFLLNSIQEPELKNSFSLVALNNHLTINSIDMPRTNEQNIQYDEQEYKKFLKGELLPHTLYVGLKEKEVYPSQYCSIENNIYVVCHR